VASAAVAAPTLAEAMGDAVGARTAAPADATRGSAGPDRPALGAVSSALRAVVPAASECLAGTGVTREGTLVFGSDGTVSGVRLTGSHPADDCVRAALTKAQVPPFRDASFSTRVAVRP
jgi:hypothetical protein